MKLSDIILNEAYIDTLASQFAKANPHLDFYVKFGSQQDLVNFGTKHDGKKFGEFLDYEVFSIDDDDRGEIVRIVKIK